MGVGVWLDSGAGTEEGRRVSLYAFWTPSGVEFAVIDYLLGVQVNQQVYSDYDLADTEFYLRTAQPPSRQSSGRPGRPGRPGQRQQRQRHGREVPGKPRRQRRKPKDPAWEMPASAASRWRRQLSVLRSLGLDKSRRMPPATAPATAPAAPAGCPGLAAAPLSAFNTPPGGSLPGAST